MGNTFRQSDISKIERFDVINSPKFSLTAACVSDDKTCVVRCITRLWGTEVAVEEAYTDPERAEAAAFQLNQLARADGESFWFEVIYPDEV